MTGRRSTVVTGEVIAIDVDAKTVTTDAGTLGPAITS